MTINEDHGLHIGKRRKSTDVGISSKFDAKRKHQNKKIDEERNATISSSEIFFVFRRKKREREREKHIYR